MGMQELRAGRSEVKFEHLIQAKYHLGSSSPFLLGTLGTAGLSHLSSPEQGSRAFSLLRSLVAQELPKGGPTLYAARVPPTAIRIISGADAQSNSAHRGWEWNAKKRRSG